MRGLLVCVSILTGLYGYSLYRQWEDNALTDLAYTSCSAELNYVEHHVLTKRQQWKFSAHLEKEASTHAR